MVYITRFVLIVMAATLSASIAAAVPIEYRLSMTFGHDGFETPHPVLVGAHLDVVYRWDAALLTPIANENNSSYSDWITNWPTSNTTAIATLSGTGGTDGAYSAAVVGPTFEWRFRDNVASEGDRDEIQFPRIEFAFNGGTVQVVGPRALFNDVFHQGPSTIFPQPFSNGAATWINPPQYRTSNPNHRSAFINVVGSAAFLPEPSAFAVAATSLFALSAIRRRQGDPTKLRDKVNATRP